MKVLELLSEGFFGGEDKDPTKRHSVVTYDMSKGKSANWAVYAGSRQVAKDKTKADAMAMVNSQVLTKKFGKLTAKQV
jgi:hypothetical protein